MKTLSRTKQFTSKFKDFILRKKHPCVMAQTVFKMEDVQIKSYGSLGQSTQTKQLFLDLKTYIEHYDPENPKFESFIAVFPDTEIEDEIDFENKLWQQLYQLHLHDDKGWDPNVDSNPNSPNFSFSIHGEAFYVVGMHPNSSRKARRAPAPALVFNLHHQFEKLRSMGVYQRVKQTIRRRDKELQGTINPMLNDFGKDSEARQYSGRKVNKEWKCPFAFH